MMIYNHKAPHRNWLPRPALNDYQIRDLSEAPTLFYDYSGLTTAAHEQDMESTTMSWAWDLKVPKNPETGEPSNGWGNLIERNRLTDEQLEHIMNAYAKDNEYLYENYDQMSDEDMLPLENTSAT